MAKRKESVSEGKNDIAHKLIKELYQDGHVFGTFRFEVNCDMGSLSYDKIVNLGKDSTGNEYSVGLVGNDLVMFTNTSKVRSRLVLDCGNGKYSLDVLGMPMDFDSFNFCEVNLIKFKCVDLSNCLVDKETFNGCYLYDAERVVFAEYDGDLADKFVFVTAKEFDFGENKLNNVCSVGNVFKFCDKLKKVSMSSEGWKNLSLADGFDEFQHNMLEKGVSIDIRD